MAREADIKKQLQDLGIYDAAFDAAIHDLVVTEHEYSRAMKAWRADAKERGKPALTTDDAYAAVKELRSEIQEQRESLGLTPLGLQKIRGKPKADGGVAGAGLAAKLDAILEALRDG